MRDSSRRGRTEGLGKWTKKNQKLTIEGQWKEGQLHGYATTRHIDQDVEEYQKTEGRLNGQYIRKSKDGRLEYREYGKGKRDGKSIDYLPDGTVVSSLLYAEGVRIGIGEDD